jgi:hypothetical protein
LLLVCVARELLRLLLLLLLLLLFLLRLLQSVSTSIHGDFAFVFVCIILRNRLLPSFNDDVDVDETRCTS